MKKLILPSTVYAHVEVAKLCEEMAQTVYEEAATRYPNWYHLNPDRAAFVRQCAPTLRQEARQLLAAMLGDEKIPEREKEQIFEALMKDYAVPGPRGVWNSDQLET